jgi:hypothetical protein
MAPGRSKEADRRAGLRDLFRGELIPGEPFQSDPLDHDLFGRDGPRPTRDAFLRRDLAVRNEIGQDNSTSTTALTTDLSAIVSLVGFCWEALVRANARVGCWIADVIEAGS